MTEIAPRKQTESKQSRTEAFEARIFTLGTYFYDEARFKAHADAELSRINTWIDSLPEYFPGYHVTKRSRELEGRDERLEKERTWLKKFSGRIPGRWVLHWGNVSEDIETAHKRRIQLSEKLLDVAVEHPIWHVVDDVAKSQRLTPLQMEALKNVQGLGDVPYRMKEVIQAQMRLRNRRLVRRKLA